MKKKRLKTLFLVNFVFVEFSWCLLALINTNGYIAPSGNVFLLQGVKTPATKQLPFVNAGPGEEKQHCWAPGLPLNGRNGADILSSPIFSYQRGNTCAVYLARLL